MEEVNSVGEDDISGHLDSQLHGLFVTLSELKSFEGVFGGTDFLDVLVPSVGPHLGYVVSEIGDENQVSKGVVTKLSDEGVDGSVVEVLNCFELLVRDGNVVGPARANDYEEENPIKVEAQEPEPWLKAGHTLPS